MTDSIQKYVGRAEDGKRKKPASLRISQSVRVGVGNWHSQQKALNGISVNDSSYTHSAETDGARGVHAEQSTGVQVLFQGTLHKGRVLSSSTPQAASVLSLIPVVSPCTDLPSAQG